MSNIVLPKAYAAIFKVLSDKDHAPINIQVEIPETLARLLMATPITAVTIGVARSGVGDISGAKLLDFK